MFEILYLSVSNIISKLQKLISVNNVIHYFIDFKCHFLQISTVLGRLMKITPLYLDAQENLSRIVDLITTLMRKHVHVKNNVNVSE